MDYELKFDPKTIEHLGVKMYSTLPPALAELISNAYDADASLVEIIFHEQNGSPISVTVRDNGIGMNALDIQNKFLVIGRNRRETDGDSPSPTFNRMPTGKKGLGKLALFGLAKNISVTTIHEKKLNKFNLSWDDLIKSESVYNPISEAVDVSTDRTNSTSITLNDLKRKSTFDIESTADSLSKLFIIDENFRIVLKKTDGQEAEVSNERRYDQINQQFSWDKSDLELDEYKFLSQIEFSLITANTPIKPQSGLRGITIFSRGKLVNAPEFFSGSTSSHFYQYLTGWIQADFIDLLDEDVISTNRQALNWENEEMAEFREWLGSLISKVGVSWREKRKVKKDQIFETQTGIDKTHWLSTLPENIRTPVETIVNTLSNDEGVDSSFHPVVLAVHKLAPEYPNLHWRHLHPEVKNASEIGYKTENYYNAFLEAVKRYANKTRDLSNVHDKSDVDLMGYVFGPEENKVLKVATGYKKINGSDFAPLTLQNIEGAQRKLSQGVIEGGRNVVAHEEQLDLSESGLFLEKDCLDLLSLISHLMYRIEPKTEDATIGS